MIEAYKNFFKGFADFSGRSTRPDFWWVWIMNSVLSIPLYITYFQAVFTEEEDVYKRQEYHTSNAQT